MHMSKSDAGVKLFSDLSNDTNKQSALYDFALPNFFNIRAVP